MDYSTHVDTLKIQVDTYDTFEQHTLLKEILGFIIESRFLYVDHKDKRIGLNKIIREYYVYAKNKVVAVVNTGISREKNKYTSRYLSKCYISITFAGLKSYNKIKDKASKDCLFRVCAFLNENNISFKITELDICIDIKADFENVMAIAIKKTPKTKYYGINERQTFSKTNYIEKISKKNLHRAIQRAYTYDKSHKEGLSSNLTRFELKLQSKYFNHYGLCLESIEKAINKYYVMYFEDLRDKFYIMGVYDKYQYFRNREVKRYSLDDYRLHPNINYVKKFINLINKIDFLDLDFGLLDYE